MESAWKHDFFVVANDRGPVLARTGHQGGVFAIIYMNPAPKPAINREEYRRMPLFP